MPWFSYPPLWAQGKKDSRGAANYDVIVISGDAYVDHPSFPTAVVTRRLQELGVRVAVIAQPDWRSTHDFKVFGAPTLFFAVCPGAMDSMVANYTSMKMPRRDDRLSPGGEGGLRPKRAAQVYAQRLREAFPDTPVILGGIEASLRRFSHYDFWEERIRDSLLIDSGAALIVYGMAEAPLRRIVEYYRQADGQGERGSPMLPQTAIRVPFRRGREIAGPGAVFLPTADECRKEPVKFLELSKILDLSVRVGGPRLVQEHPKGDIICFPPDRLDWEQEPDLISRPMFNRRSHPLYTQPIPGLEPVQFSVISHRGCLGACSFCALALHQGRTIRSRLPETILAEIQRFPDHPDFRGTIPDLGGPSVNMYGWKCRHNGCPSGQCLYPRRCEQAGGNLAPLVELLRQARAVSGVRHVFIGSGLRYDLLTPADEKAFEELVKFHVSGQLKVAPEHVDPRVLELMRKAPGADFAAFARRFGERFGSGPEKRFLVPYFMTAFPGSGESDAGIRLLVQSLRLAHDQIQDFTPTPGTLATAMYYAGVDLRGNPIDVPKTTAERRKGKQLVQKK
jgi:uncharacterized radical SAM protein YgiQ